MPNHITNILTIHSDESTILSIKTLLQGEDEDIDFNKIIPEPSEIREVPYKMSKSSNMPDWYNWRIEHWGTKWNAYESISKDSQIRFLTAWDTPINVVKELSKMFPDISFEITYADEDIGSNVGRYEYMNGEITFQEELSGTKDGFELAINTIYGTTSEDYIESMDKETQEYFMKHYNNLV